MPNFLISHLADVSLRSLPLAVAAFAVLRIPRLRNAAWAHAVWTVVLLSMLVLFAAGPALKPIPLRVLPAPAAVQASQPAVFEGLARFSLPMPASRAAAPVVAAPPAPRRGSASELAAWVYGAIAALLFARLLVGSWLAHRLLAGSVRAGEDFYESPRVAVPLTIGWLRPSILLPESWRSWEAQKLEAVLLHERAHLRRRDSLVALLARINRCLFWFHPLAWWMERKLAFLAEQACDEACVYALENRRAYAAVLLEMAAAVEASGGRLSGHALAMARPSQVRRRIDAILEETRGAHRGLTAAAWTAVLLCAVPMIYAAGSLRIEPKLSFPRPVLTGAFELNLPDRSPFVRPQPFLTAQVRQAPAPTPARPLPATAAPLPVLLPVTVTEPAGRYVTGLTAENFRIMEDRVQAGQNPNVIVTAGKLEQPIVIFRSAEGQHTVAVLDTIGDNQDAVKELQKTLSPQDELSVSPAPPVDSEGFRIALLGALAELKDRPNPVKSLIVLTRGVARSPLGPERVDRDILVTALNAPRVAVYFADVEDIAETASFPPAYTLLEDLRIVASTTGGQLVPVARAEEMKTALARIGMGLRNQYVLGFVPTAGTPIGFRRLSVEIVRTLGLPKMQAIGPQAYIP
ncbi:MAG TPA: M56 family metallopeptidase [Bryobacteraceae bacterium]